MSRPGEGSRTGEALWRAGVALLGALLLAVMLYPLVWLALTAFKADGELERNPWGLPERWRWENLREVLAPQYGLARAWLKSLLVTGLAVGLTTFAAALAGWAASRLRFRGAGALFALFLLGLALPIHVALIPLHQLLVARLGWDGHVLAVLGPYVGFSLPVGVFLYRGFFAALPRELEEAASCDGAGHWQAFWHVALPLARPATATVAIFTALNSWNEYAFAQTLINAPAARTLPLALKTFTDGQSAQFHLIAAALLVAVVPLVVGYAFASRQIISGLTAGALRG